MMDPQGVWRIAVNAAIADHGFNYQLIDVVLGRYVGMIFDRNDALLAAEAPRLLLVLRQIVTLDEDAQPGLVTWREARAKAAKQARGLLEDLDRKAEEAAQAGLRG